MLGLGAVQLMGCVLLGAQLVNFSRNCGLDPDCWNLIAIVSGKCM